MDVFYSEELAEKGDKNVGKILYRIQYEDGDNEELTLAEVKALLLAQRGLLDRRRAAAPTPPRNSPHSSLHGATLTRRHTTSPQ